MRSVKHYFGDKKVVILTGVMKDKDYRYIASCLSQIVVSAYTITPDNSRALDADDYAKTLSDLGVYSTACESVKSALDAAIADAQKRDTALVCLGSLYMYKEVAENI